MDIERFQKFAQDAKRTKVELLNMLKNAEDKSEEEFAGIVKDQLDLKFPGWGQVSSRRGGKTPTDVMLRGEKRHFDSAKEAYIWLIERFIAAHPETFVRINWETAFVARGKSRLYFARALGKMFPKSPHLADDPNKYARLSNGWFANLNLANREKFQLLLKFAAVAKFSSNEWLWQVEGTTDPDSDLVF